MLKYRVFSLVVVCCFCIIVRGQEIYHPVYDVTQNNPKAPAVSGLFQYQKFPVNMSTGIANIDLPVYEVVEGNIRVPISISFSTGGIKVNQTPTCLGIGWTLNCGGMIYQKVNGLDDLGGNEGDIPGGGTYFDTDMTSVSPIPSSIQPVNNIKDFIAFFNNASSTGNSHNMHLSHRFIGKIIDGVIDGEADEFKVSLPSFSNTIFYDQQAQECKIAKTDGLWIYNWPTMVGEGWLLKDKSGLDYYFAPPLNYKNPLYYNPQSIPSGNPANPTGGSNIKNTYLNDTWPLEQIRDIRSDKYVDFVYSRITTTVPNMNHGNSPYREYPAGAFTKGASGSILEYYEREEAQMEEIRFSNGKVQFVYYASQQNQFGPKLLKNIKVLNSASQPVKIISFFYVQKPTTGSGGTIDYVNTCNFLDKITETVIVNSIEYNTDLYKFEYINDLGFPKRFSFAQDKWGYYNGQNANTTFFPADILALFNTQNGPAGANRSISQTHCREGNLKTVIYPTKGRSEFTYESNMSGSTVWGGQRVKEIAYKALDGHSDMISKYSYDANTATVIQPAFYKIHQDGTIGDNHTVISVKGTSLTPIGLNGSNGIFYSKVDNYLNGSTTGKTTHYFSYLGEIPWSDNYMGFPYTKVNNLMELGMMETKTETYRYNPTSLLNELINVQEKDIQPINNLNNYVTNIQGYWSQPGIAPTAVYMQGNDPYSSAPYPELNMSPIENYYKLYSDAYLPAEKTNTVYEAGNQLTDKEELEYDEITGSVKLQRKFSSTGDITETRIKFAKDYTLFSNPANSWDAMLQATLAASPIEIAVYRKKAADPAFSLIKSTLYKYEQNNIKEVYVIETDRPLTDFTPAYNTSSQFMYDNRYSKKFEVLNFDINYNPTLVMDNKKSIGYLYDHTNTYAVAVVENLNTLNDAAYSSFEMAAKGNWTYNGTITEPSFAPTGKKIYNLATGNISKGSLNSGKEYTVSYWSDNGAKNVSGFSSTQGRTINGFTYYEHKITGVTSVTISGTGNLDELRLYPVTARMTSQTYIPLVGISSQCDVNNRINYYEYDASNRLAIIRDQDKNVVKKYCYKYSGQQEDCTFSCTNTTANWQNTAEPLRCQQTTTGCYTGYQEQQQQDMNPCSVTYSQLQWVQAAYNPGACASGINVSVVNTAGITDMAVTYTDVNNPSTQYTFNIPASSSVLGCLPSGRYNIQVYYTGGSFPPMVLVSCGASSVSGVPATFYNVDLGRIGNRTITLEYDF